MTSCNKKIGGYLELELEMEAQEYYSKLVKLNTGRNALEYILRLRGYKQIYIPYYTCEAILEPLTKLGVRHMFYRINKQLEIEDEILRSSHTALLYTNYFGLKQEYVYTLKNKYSNLIIDNAQAFFSEPISDLDTFYSPRKFFGIPDGAYVSTNQPLQLSLREDESYSRCSHLLKRIDVGVTKGYEDFKANDRALSNQEIKAMSKLTQALLNNINYEKAKSRRKTNFKLLQEALGRSNLFQLQVSNNGVPMVYPYLSANDNLKNILLSEGIFVATYWPNVIDWTKKGQWEHTLTEKLIPLPIDQRYGNEEMGRIIEIVNKNV